MVPAVSLPCEVSPDVSLLAVPLDVPFDVASDPEIIGELLPLSLVLVVSDGPLMRRQ